MLKIPGGQIMVDCGPATTHKLVKAGLWPTDIDYLFFTHHHFDHDVDYPCFLLCRWDQSNGNENRLQVFGPNPTEKLTEGIISEDGIFAHDWKARINAPLSQTVFTRRGGTLPRTPPSVSARDVAPGKVFSGEDWEVHAARAEHVQPYLDSLAYRVDSPEGSIVFTGDTNPCQTVVDLARGADAMLCMCSHAEETAGSMAQEAGVKKLVLVHIGPELARHGPMEKGIGDVRKIYNGEVIFSDELMSFEV